MVGMQTHPTLVSVGASSLDLQDHTQRCGSHELGGGALMTLDVNIRCMSWPSPRNGWLWGMQPSSFTEDQLAS